MKVLYPKFGKNQVPFLSKEKNKPRLRLYAFTIDTIAIFFLTRLFQSSYLYFMKTYLKALPAAKKLQVIANIDHTTFLLYSTLFLGYFSFINYINHGKSLGNVFFQLEVTPKNFNIVTPTYSRHLNLTQSLMRALGSYINLIFFTSILFIPICLLAFIRKDHRGIPDFMSHTQVLFEYEIDEILERKHSLEEPEQPELFKLVS